MVLEQHQTWIGTIPQTMPTDMDEAYVSRIEAGQMNVTLETAAQFAAALGTDIAELFIAPPRR